MTMATLSPIDERLLLNAAVAAPSVHNTQPWLFRVSDGRVDLLADRTRQLREQDPEGRALLVSCGAALLNLRVATEHVGYEPHVELLPDPPDRTVSITEAKKHQPFNAKDFEGVALRIGWIRIVAPGP